MSRRTGNNYSGARWTFARRSLHGRPHYYECQVEGCDRDGHKCYRPDCTDPLHTHPSAAEAGEVAPPAAEGES